MSALRNILIVSLALGSFSARANTVSTVFWPDSPLPPVLRALALQSVEHSCRGVVRPGALREVETTVRGLSSPVHGLQLFFRTVFQLRVFYRGFQKSERIFIDAMAESLGSSEQTVKVLRVYSSPLAPPVCR